jgi:hypothetical protein
LLQPNLFTNEVFEPRAVLTALRSYIRFKPPIPPYVTDVHRAYGFKGDSLRTYHAEVLKKLKGHEPAITIHRYIYNMYRILEDKIDVDVNTPGVFNPDQYRGDIMRKINVKAVYFDKLLCDWTKIVIMSCVPYNCYKDSVVRYIDQGARVSRGTKKLLIVPQNRRNKYLDDPETTNPGRVIVSVDNERVSMDDSSSSEEAKNAGTDNENNGTGDDVSDVDDGVVDGVVDGVERGTGVDVDVDVDVDVVVVVYVNGCCCWYTWVS